MKTNFFSIITALLCVTTLFAQESINNYKYVIVPNKYEFLKEKDQYQLNSLTQFLFEKYGFISVMQGASYPEDLNINRCLAMTSDVIKDSGMFTTKLKVILKDCNEKELYQSAMGTSREKDYKVAYNKALREAFKSFETLNYVYTPSEDVVAPVASGAIAKSESEEIKQLKQQIEKLESEKSAPVVTNTSSPSKAAAVTSATVTTAAVTTAVVKETSSIQPTETELKSVNQPVLYAQQIENGYQLVDSTPKVVYKVKKTNLEHVFLVEGKSAIVFKKGDTWVVEYYEDNMLKQQELNIKF